jgi:hypothetical protein
MVEFYLQILLPAYRFSIGFQRTKANIAEVLPSLLILFNTYNKLAQNKKFKPICLTMIESFKFKFDYELTSNVYLVSSVLNTSKLDLWYWKKFSESYAEKVSKELISVASSFLKIESPKKVVNKIYNPVDSDDDDDLLIRMLKNDDDEEYEVNEGETTNSLVKNLRNKKEIFFLLISSSQELEGDAKTTKGFWNEIKKRCLLFKVARSLHTIPASSAFIERFFSVCGVVCKNRCGNMSTDLIIKRSFLKCNIDILNQLSQN